MVMKTGNGNLRMHGTLIEAAAGCLEGSPSNQNTSSSSFSIVHYRCEIAFLLLPVKAFLQVICPAAEVPKPLSGSVFPIVDVNSLRSIEKLITLSLIQVIIGTIMLCADTQAVLSVPGNEFPHIVSWSDMNRGILNPAVLGVNEATGGERKLLSYSNSFSAGYWSDKLALKPYREFFSINKNGHWKQLVTRLISESFGVAGKTAEKTSQKITEKVKGGLSIYGASDISFLEITLNTVAVDVRILTDVQTDLPDAPFLILFSEEEGIRRGTNLSLSHMGAQLRVTTDITTSYGSSIDLPRIPEICNEVTGFTDFKKVLWGGGLTVSLGNCFLDMQTIDGGVGLNDDGTEMRITADMNLKTTGTGLSGNWRFESPLENGIPVVGGGAGINTGVLLYGDRTSIGIAFRRLGFMYWKDIQEADITFRTRPLSTVDFIAAELTDSGYDFFDTTEGGYFPDAENGDSLSEGADLLQWQPARAGIRFGYLIDLEKNAETKINAFSRYVTMTFEYEQSLIKWPGRSFLPRITMGIENGFLWGTVPGYVELIFGGAEKVASSAGFAVVMPYLQLQFGYQAIGTPYWYPKRGMKASFALCMEWVGRMHPN